MNLKFLICAVLLAAVLLFVAICAHAQYSVPSSGLDGMKVCIGPGTNTLTGPLVTYAGSCFTLTPNAINYGYIDSTTGNVTVGVNGFPNSSIPIFQALTDNTVVKSVTDKRPTFTGGPLGGGTGNVSTAPSVSQAIVQPVGTQFSVNNDNGVRKAVASYNWQQSPAGTLSAGANTVTLTPCPLGVDNHSVSANTLQHWFLITSAGGDTSPNEPVQLSGGTCTSGAPSGTVTFAASFAHIAGWKIGSATAGIQECERDGALQSAGYPNAAGLGGIGNACALVAGQTYEMYGPLFIQNYRGTLYGNNALIDCNFWMACLNLGDTSQGGSTNAWTETAVYDLQIGPGMLAWTVTPSAPSTIPGNSANATLTIPTCPAGFYAAIPNQMLWLNGASSSLGSTPYGFGEFVFTTGGTCTPGLVNGTIAITQATPGISTLSSHDSGYTLTAGVHPMIRDNSNNAHIQNVAMMNAKSVPSGKAGALIWNDNDQNETIIKIANLGYQYQCTANFCSSMIFSPGPFSGGGNGDRAGVTNVYGSDFSMACTGNGATWFSGNTLNITDSIIQGYAQWGVKHSMNRGGFGNVLSLKNPYWEVGSCTNPIGTGQASIISQGTKVVNSGPSSPNSSWPNYLNNGGTIQTYYIVYKNSNGKISYPLPVGLANVTDPSVNNVNVDFPAPSGFGGINATANFDILRVAGTSIEPTGTGNFAVATNLAPATPAGQWQGCNSTGRCRFVDNVAPASLASYTPNANQNNDFSPGTDIVAGAVVLGTAGNTTNGLYSSAGSVGTYAGTGTCVSTTAQTGAITATFTEGYNNGGGTCLSSLRGQSIPFPLPQIAGSSGPQMATLMPNGQYAASTVGASTFQTGRLNFGGAFIASPMDVITLYDDNEKATEAAQLQRRALASGQIGLGLEAYNNLKAYLRAPAGLNIYAGGVPNSTNGVDSTTQVASFGASLATVNTPVQVQSVAFASLPASPNGSIIYCNNCNATCSASGGTGRMCFRENGAWTH